MAAWTETPVRTVPAADLGPADPGVVAFIGHALKPRWHVVGHWDGNHRVIAIPLHGFEDADQPPTRADLARHFGPVAITQRKHRFCLIFAYHTGQAVELYRKAS